MSSYVSIYLHVVFATKSREYLITPDIRDRLYPFLIRTAENTETKIHAIGGVENHIHLLLSLGPLSSAGKSVQTLKSNASRWINETFKMPKPFQWQEGYAAFSVSCARLDAVKQYINNQAEHHRAKTFREELEAFLREHGMVLKDYDKANF